MLLTGAVVVAPDALLAQPRDDGNLLTRLPTVDVLAVTCPLADDAGPLAPTYREHIAQVLQQVPGWRLDVVSDHPACVAQARPSPADAAAPDILTWVSWPKAMDGQAARLLVQVRWPGKGLEIQVQGREFVASPAASLLELPLTDADKGSETSSEPPALSVRTRTLLGGLVNLVASEKLARAADGDSQQQQQVARARDQALAALASGDDIAHPLPPSTSATLKQLRAMMLLRGACTDETPAALLRAAARLVPHDGGARTLAAIGQLRESYETSPCVAIAEDELVRAVALEPWSTQAIMNLGVFYELARNAPPARTPAAADTSDLAEQRLSQVWRQEAPKTPVAVELGVGGGPMLSLGGPNAYVVPNLAPGARLDVTIAPDGSGWGWRLGAALPWTRQVNLGEGLYSWTRLSLAGGGRYRLRLGRYFGELGANLLLAPVWAKGNGFDDDRSAVGLDVGAENQLRLGRRFGRLFVWLGGAAGYMFGRHIERWPNLEVHVDGLQRREQLPPWEVSLLVGFSTYWWL